MGACFSCLGKRQNSCTGISTLEEQSAGTPGGGGHNQPQPQCRFYSNPPLSASDCMSAPTTLGGAGGRGWALGGGVGPMARPVYLGKGLHISPTTGVERERAVFSNARCKSLWVILQWHLASYSICMNAIEFINLPYLITPHHLWIYLVLVSNCSSLKRLSDHYI